jgi:hypothetical protein
VNLALASTIPAHNTMNKQITTIRFMLPLLLSSQSLPSRMYFRDAKVSARKHFANTGKIIMTPGR